jgi:exopolysaccharide biosynthesis polyprenyl glycosylphosphotransferase
MSTVLRPERSSTWVDAVDVPTPGEISPFPRQRAFRGALFSAGWKRALNAAGRFTAVALPTVALAYPAHLRPVAAVGLTLLVIALWWTALRIAFRTTLLALGPAAAAVVGTVVGLVLVSALALWVPELELSPTLLLEIAGLIFLFTTGWEAFGQKRLARRQKVLILGTTDVASDVAEETERAAEGRFDVIGVVAEGASSRHELPPLLGSLVQLAEVVDAQQPDLVVLADADPGPAVDRLLETSWQRFRVVSVSHFFEHAFGRVPLAHISPSWFMSILHLRQRSYDDWSKRAFDITVALIGFALAAPLLVFAAIAVRLSGKPVLFRQTRLGERGKKFEMYKFRTMIQSGEADGRARWAAEADPRVTRVGRALRRTRVDELPQLWNVMRGDMSIVGPRPERPEFVCVLEENVPFWNRRLLVKPGVTGWAQVRNGYAADRDSTMQKLSYDLWYVRHRTLLLDLAICAKTLLTVVSGAGAR